MWALYLTEIRFTEEHQDSSSRRLQQGTTSQTRFPQIYWTAILLQFMHKIYSNNIALLFLKFEFGL